MNMAYRHIHTALRFALSGDEQGLGSRGAEPCFPAPPPAPALRFQELLELYETYVSRAQLLAHRMDYPPRSPATEVERHQLVQM